MTAKPNPHSGLRHIALLVQQLEKCVDFYSTLLGLKIVWQPDPDNIYLSSGTDNLALHRAAKDIDTKGTQRLDHLGFFLKQKADVDAWYQFLKEKNVKIIAAPKDHRDGTRSFYCADPDGNVVQLIYYPL